MAAKWVSSARRSRSRRRGVLVGLTAGGWLGSAGLGMWVMCGYANTPGARIAPLIHWPETAEVEREENGYTMIMAIHPRCPCTRASLNELARVMRYERGNVRAYALFVVPEGFADGWERSDLWSMAAAIPGVTPVKDDRGREASLFQMRTSGATALYDAEGRLVFSGGVTPGRGHEGANAGRSALIKLLKGADRDEAFVTDAFGCSLFESEACAESGLEGEVCR